MVKAVDSLRPVLQPESVAVIGASTRLETLGGKTFHNLLRAGFTGRVYPVNPGAPEVQGVKAFPAISEVPGDIDLAVVIVPRDAVLPALEACGEKGVKAAAIVSAGFSETGPEGAELERRLVEVARRHGIRLLGPNCMGAINTDPAVSLDTTFSPVPVIAGGVGLVSQSGAFGVAILSLAAGLNLGFSSFLSIGNVADIDVVDALDYWMEDERTRVVAMYVESLGDVSDFASRARQLSKRKPLLAVKAGRSEAGARAASSHTGALATDELALEGLFRQCGVLRAPTVQDLCYWAAAFESCPVPEGRRVGIITNAGGPAIMAADACSFQGLELPELSDDVQKALREFLPPEAAVFNPVDMIASATPGDYRMAVEIVASDPVVDMVLVLNVTPPILYKPLDVIEAISNLGISDSKPVVSAFMAEDAFYPEAVRVSGAPPVYRFPEPAVRSLRALVDYSEMQARTDESYDRFSVDRNVVEEVISRLDLSHREGEGSAQLLPCSETADLLEAYGISLPRQEVVITVAEAAEAAERIGGNVALKALGLDVLHKSDAGAVALHLQGAEEVLSEATRIEAAVAEHGYNVGGFIVQEMVEGGVELIVSVREDPEFGRLLLVGLGGLFTEALKDAQIGVLPVTPSDSREMLQALKGYGVLTGQVRGQGAHIPSIIELMGRVTQMAEELPRLSEIELNPVICLPEPGRCYSVDAVIRTGPLG